MSQPRVWVNPRAPRHDTRSPRALAQDVGPVVYYIRTEGGLVKIGFTRDIATRRYNLSHAWDRLLAITAGTMTDEQAEHRRWAEHRAYGEYYHPAPELMAHINELRQRLGVAPTNLEEQPQ